MWNFFVIITVIHTIFQIANELVGFIHNVLGSIALAMDIRNKKNNRR